MSGLVPGVTPKKVLVCVLLCLGTRSAGADGWLPDEGFVQVAEGDAETYSFIVGAQWHNEWARRYRFGAFDLHTDASIGRWHSRTALPGERRWVTHIGITPVVRWRPLSQPSPWFIDVGVGLNLITPRFHANQKIFSTEFNFGDHLGVGYDLPTRRHQALMLRFEHFSNGGIDRPNPGENFLELRYSFGL